MSIKGWTKMDDGSWRHDKSEYRQNKLNVYANMGEDKVHIADKQGRSRPMHYEVIYTYHESNRSGSYLVDQFDSKREALKCAADFMRDNYEAPDPDDIGNSGGLFGR